MKNDIKTRWIYALRSGAYEQTQEKLTDGNSFCCLGVLCDIAQGDGIGRWEEADGTIYFVTDDVSGPGECADTDPPGDVLTWSGVDVAETTKLVNMNDHLDDTFIEIANYIELNL